MSGPGRPNTSSSTDDDSNRGTTSGSSSSRPGSGSGRRNSAVTAPKLEQFLGLRGHKGAPGASNIPVPSMNKGHFKNAAGGKQTTISGGGGALDQNRNTMTLMRIQEKSADVGGSDHETERSRNLYRTTSPLFTLKLDAELDNSLEMALEKSISLASAVTGGTGAMQNVQNGDLNWVEFRICDGHPPKWKEFLDHGTLCDCTIQANDGKIFPAHRCILASSCPFFHEKLSSGNQHPSTSSTSTPDMEASPTLRLTTVDSKTLKCLIDFAYTGQFEKSLDTVTNLLQVATKFKMVPVMQQCCAYLIEKMTPDNTLRLYRLGRPYFCPKLETKAKTYILHNFRRVIGTQDFLELEPEELKVILLDDYLNVRNEAMVFEAIRAWVEAYPHRRRKYVAEMLSCVRFGLMSYGYFSNVVYQWHFVNEDEAVRSVLDAPYVLLTSIDSLNNTEVDLNDPLARPRIPYEVIFAVGGWSAGSPTAFIETYDIRADRWFLLNNTDSTPRAYHGLVAVGHFVYMIGGFDGQEHFSTVKRYDPVRQIWEERSCMLLPRCYVSCCSLDGIIYACGGYNGRTRMASGERYDPALNQWEMISSMNRQRSDASAASLRGKVYIAGGFTGTEVLISVETYDPAEDQWTFIQPMNTPRSGISLVAYRDCLYAVGGFNGFNRLNTAERYDPEEPGPWRMIPDMSSARSNFAAVCADELLICIGGFNGATTIPYVECYDSKVNEWFDGSHMNLNRSALSACVVTNLPNARDYSYLHRIQELLGLPNRENSP